MLTEAAMTHLMVDLETMGTSPGCPIVSIGAVAFDPREGTLGDHFYETVSLDSCMKAGLAPSAGTIMWWLDQSDAARKALTQAQNPLALSDALQRFASFYRDHGFAYLWCHGANFDEPVLSAAYRAVDIEQPWPYNAARDTRTLFLLTGTKVDHSAGTQHNALDDAVAQAEAVIRGYSAFHSVQNALRRFINPTGHTDACAELKGMGALNCTETCACARETLAAAGVTLDDAFEQIAAE